MAISRKEFEEGNFAVLRGKAYVILEFLKSNKDKAYLSQEIATTLKIPKISITPVLKKMMDQDLIEKKGPYYTLSRSDKKVIQESKSKSKPQEVEEVEEEFEDEEEGEPYEPYEGEDTVSEKAPIN